MNKLLENKLVWVAGLLVFFNVLLFVGSKIIIDKSAEAVIEKLEKEYSPSPYGPGFDPDTITPETIRRRALLQNYIQSRNGGKALFYEDESETFDEVKIADDWRDNWEDERGFSS